MTQSQSRPTTAKESLLARLLDPVDRLTEAMYSVLIVLTFTLAYQISDLGSSVSFVIAQVQISQMFAAALGCAVAWGLIDGVMYIVSAMFERSQDYRLIQTIRDAATEQEGVTLLAGQLDDELTPLATVDERTNLYAALYRRLKGATPQTVGFARADFAGALGVALAAVAAAVPVLLPLLLSHTNPFLAIRLSNAVAFVMLFGMGYRWGKHVGATPWKVGLALLLVGLVMMGIALPLGG